MPIDPDRLYNIVPENDLRPHREGVDCECRPIVQVQENGNVLIVHFAWDCREYFES